MVSDEVTKTKLMFKGLDVPQMTMLDLQCNEAENMRRMWSHLATLAFSSILAIFSNKWVLTRCV
jgi:hypothetical protein